MQPHLPQLLLPKDAALSRAEKHRLEALAPPLAWYQGTNGWVTAPVLCGILTRLRREIRAVRPGAGIVVVMDSASQHLAVSVLSHAARLQIRLVLVPARMTWLLQPLDTRVIALLKRTICSKQEALRAVECQCCVASS